MRLSTRGHWFVDGTGRSVLLRGVNLGGSTKLPFGVGPLDRPGCEGRAISFIGRPFPLKDADEHYRRLRRWGFNALRFLTTWEAIEHRGPGQYDEAYLDYLEAVVKKAGDHGFQVFLDPHQDAWSRWSGGDGAPLWTLELAGFEPSRFDQSEAAITMSGRYPDYGTMVWPNNWGRLASCTMFTLFFAGRRFAPDFKIEGQSADDYLQTHFIAAMRQVARRMRGFEHVLGYDTLNEPSAGYIGLASLSAKLPVYGSAPQLTGLQSLAVPAGLTADVEFLERQHLQQKKTGMVTLNPERVSAWKNANADIWRQHGLWDVDAAGQPRVLKDGYFAGVHAFSECMLPFAKKFALAMREEHPGSFCFVEGEPAAAEPIRWDIDVPVVNASHWYDLLTLITKHYDPAAALVWGSEQFVVGEAAVRQSFAAQIGAHLDVSRQHLNGAPTLIGEFGLAYDLDGGKAFRDGDFSAQEAALGAYFDAIDAHLAHSTLWNYTADNTNRDGDGWNQEDLSIYSADQARGAAPNDPDAGARALKGFCRPTLRAAAGEPKAQSFALDRQSYRLDLLVNSQLNESTDIFVPETQFPEVATRRGIKVSSGTTSYDQKTQVLRWQGAAAGLQTLEITRLNSPS